MNKIGFSLLALLVLQWVISIYVYYVMALSRGAQVHFYGFTPQGYIKMIAEIRKGISGSAFTQSLPLFFATLVGNIFPFLLCARGVDVNIKGLFSRPKISGGTTAIYGIIALGGSLVAGIAVSLLSVLFKFLHLELTTPSFNVPWSSPASAAVLIFTIVVLAPITEEFVCRGVILTVFRRFGDVFAIVGSSLIWALLHGNFIQGIPVFLMGLCFGILAIKSGSIVPSIVLHAINNVISLLEVTLVAQNSLAIKGIVGLFNLSVMFAAVTLFVLFNRYFRGMRKGESKCGFKLFFTCIPILITLLIFAAITVMSVKPL